MRPYEIVILHMLLNKLYDEQMLNNTVRYDSILAIRKVKNILSKRLPAARKKLENFKIDAQQ